MLVVIVAVFICVFLYLRKPFLFFPINLHICSPSELKRSILCCAFQQDLFPPASSVHVRVRDPCKQYGKEQAVLKKGH